LTSIGVLTIGWIQGLRFDDHLLELSLGAVKVDDLVFYVFEV
jgi:hypothetical protein